MRFLKGITFSLVSFLTVFGLIAFPAFASSMYPGTQTGHDVSYPNSTLPSSGSFGIVGVNAGRPFTYNSNFTSQYAWASSYSPVAPSAFINLAEAIGSNASKGDTGPDGTCSKKDKTCVAYNFGYNAAQDAYNHFSLLTTASIFWLDIETSNSWSSNTSLNRATIDGAAAFFQGGQAPNGKPVTGIGKPVGIYSTPGMWQTITKGYQNNLPTWTATSETSSINAAAHCVRHDFTNGQTYLVQYSDGSGFDADYACN